MNKEEFFKQYAGKYRLVKFIIDGKDCSESYTNGWKDKSMYMFFDISADGQFFLKVHTENGDKAYEYFFSPEEMKYHTKADSSDEGIPITIENGVLTEETKDHLMVYEQTDELDKCNS